MQQTQSTPKGERIIALDVHETQLSVALIEASKVVEALSLTDVGPQIGDIYLGRVQQVQKGMDAAFVDIGLTKHGFLQLEPGRTQCKPGQEIMVQITKLPGGDKGVRVTRAIEIANASMVLIPGEAGVGVSAKIKDAQERARLKACGEAIGPADCALVMRTAASGQSEQVLMAVYQILSMEWASLCNAARFAPAPALLKAAPHPAERFVVDLLGAGCDRIVVNDDAWHTRLAALLERGAFHHKPSLERYGGTTPLCALYPIQTALEHARRRKIWLPGGGSLVFDTCEAMTVIDVNAGKQLSKCSFEETALSVNLEAMREIGTQIRLRDIGGILVIDTIDLREEAHRKDMLAALEGALAADRGKPKVYGGVSALGLIQLTRKRLYAAPNSGNAKQLNVEDAER